MQPDAEYHPWLRGYKISLTFSCPSELLTKIHEFREEERMNMTNAMRKLVVYGLIYKKVLEEQALTEAVEKPKQKRKKKAKPKTPSK